MRRILKASLAILMIASVSAADVGTYSVSRDAPVGSIFNGGSPVNQTDCAAINAVNIGGVATIPLAGNAGAIDFTVIYNGTTFDNLPAGAFGLPNIAGNVTNITTRANGFDSGNPVFDEIVCDIDYNPPTSVCTHDPDTTINPVDSGTVISLFLASANAVSATVNGGGMTPNVAPNNNLNVEWSATHTALGDTTLNGVATNPDGETSSCTWPIDVIVPVITVAPTAGLVTTEAGGSDTFTISVDEPPNSNVTIGISSSDPGEGMADTTAVVFTPANWMTPQTVTISGVDDASVDGDIAYSIVTADVSSSDSNYAFLVVDDVSVTNTDDDMDPPVNQTVCAAINAVDIGGVATIPLAGNAGAIDFTVIYNGTTYDNLPAGAFGLPNIVGNVTNITTRANGLDSMANPVFDEIVCDIDYNPPTSVCTQSPNSAINPVDSGTVITLTLASTNAVNARVNGSGMTPGVDPNNNLNVDWSASHTAVGDTTLNGVATNPDGETSSCTWPINIIVPVITVAPTAGLVTTEAGGSDTFTISVDRRPDSDVTIGISSSDPGEGVADTTAVVFTRANWMSPQTVTITGVDDASVDGDIAYSIVTADVSSADSNYDRLVVDDVSVTNTDDDVDPPVNQTVCAAINAVDIGGVATIPLAGNPAAIDFTVIYNGTTFDNLPAGAFGLPNIVGNVSNITTRANGLDFTGNPVFDEIVCDIDYNPPTSVCSQDPDSTINPVDLGTVITLTLDSTNAVSATVDAVGMTPDVDPNDNLNVGWSATHTAVGDTTLNGVATNPDGETSSCTWPIDIIIVPVITVAPTAGLVTTEAGGSDTFTISVDQPPNSNVTIGISSSDPGEGMADTTAVVFTAANWMTPQTVTISGVDDASVDGDIAYSIVTADVSSADSNYDGLMVDDVSVTNTDDDTATLSIDDISFAEGTGVNQTVQFTVTLDMAVDGGFTADIATMDGSAVAPGDYAAGSGMLTLSGNAGETQGVAVSIVGDSEFEPDEIFTLVISNASNPGVVLGGPGTATILNDDGADLSMSLQVVPGQGTSGDFFEATATSTNNGTGEATDVEIRVELAQQLVIVSADAGAGGTCNIPPPSGGGVVTCVYPGATPVGGERSVVLLLNSLNPGQSVISASTSSALNDPDPSNNAASAAVGASVQQIPTLNPTVLAMLVLLIAGMGMAVSRSRV